MNNVSPYCLKYFATVAAVILLVPAYNQLKWKPSIRHNDRLPASVRVFETTDSLDGRPFRAFYLSAETAGGALSFETRTGNGKRYTPEQFLSKESEKVYAIVNTTFFSFADNRPLNMVVNKGKTIANNLLTDTIKLPDGSRRVIYPTRGVFGILRDGSPDIAWVYPFGKKFKAYEYRFPNSSVNGQWRAPMRNKAKPWRPIEAAGGGPVLLPYISSVQENQFAWRELDKHPRTAIGYTADKRVIILVVEGRHPGVADGATLPQLANIMRNLGCVEALNLDGGGSSCMIAGNQHTIQPSDKNGARPVPAVLLIRPSNH